VNPMAYELHIEKHEGTLSLDEWKEAVASSEGVRLLSQDHSITNSETGEIISLPRRHGDAEVFFPDQQVWRSAFRWANGRASFRANFSPGDLSNPIWRAAVGLASSLNAIVRGDEGEIYDLATGEVING